MRAEKRYRAGGRAPQRPRAPYARARRQSTADRATAYRRRPPAHPPAVGGRAALITAGRLSSQADYPPARPPSHPPRAIRFSNYCIEFYMYSIMYSGIGKLL
ncbi:hypothetical protein EVAR_100252_1 [Eumeta japonica]|uniref:Uncharacterized protein n=1 Tax=Eumeta variegata TaxID=151549 RepID=A0A4C2A980_EUMVA|nr:hypothetical protein EVAR_100252_1 [Eumeta japonica]